MARYFLNWCEDGFQIDNFMETAYNPTVLRNFAQGVLGINITGLSSYSFNDHKIVNRK